MTQNEFKARIEALEALSEDRSDTLRAIRRRVEAMLKDWQSVTLEDLTEALGDIYEMADEATR